MPKATTPHPRRNPVSLSLPPSALDDNYGDLSVIQVTPRGDSENGLHLHGSEESSADSTSWARTPKSRKESNGSTPRSVSSLFSTLTRNWSKSRSKEDSSSWENENGLNRAIFSSIDGEDAREFGEFVMEDGGEVDRIPVLCLAEYGGVEGYALDIFVIMHNTLRRELLDALKLVRVIRREFLALTVGDIYELRKWWRLFVIVWKVFEHYETHVLHPLIQQILIVDGRGDVLRRKLQPLEETKEWLQLKMEEMTSYIEEFEQLRPGRALSLFCKTVDSFAERCALYFTNRERLLPRLIENYHDKQVKQSSEKALVSHLRSTRHFPELTVCLIRWMGNVHGNATLSKSERERERWITCHLHWLERQNLSRFYQRFNTCHGNILTHFTHKLQTSDSL